MSHTAHQWTVLAALAVASGTAMPAETQAVELEVQMTGLDVFFGFDGKNNIQTGPRAGQTDDVETATFFVDGVSIGTLVGGITANFGIPSFEIDEDGGVFLNKSRLGYVNFDFDAPTARSGFLNLGLSDAMTVQTFYTGNEFGLSIFGASDELAAQEPIARLPQWPGFSSGDSIKFSFVSTNLSQVETRDGLLSQFLASGTGNINQETDVVIPEPASVALLGLGGLTLLRRRRA